MASFGQRVRTAIQDPAAIRRFLRDRRARRSRATADRASDDGFPNRLDRLPEPVVHVGGRRANAAVDREAGVPLLEECLADAGSVAVHDSKEYANVLRVLHRQQAHIPVEVDRSGFEMVGSDLPILPNIGSTEMHLHHYFSEHFGMRDPVQVHVEAWQGDACIHSTTRIMGVDETWSFTSEDLGFTSDGYVRVRCWHPTLTRGRHQRMRIAADVRAPGGLATLHSTHDFGPAWPHRMVLDAEVPAALTIPNHDGNLFAQSTIQVDDEPRPHPGGRLGRIQLETGFHAVGFDGYGTPFWFQRGEQMLASNHYVTSRFDALAPPPVDAAKAKRYQRLEADGLRFHNHILPILPDLDTAFRLDASTPTVTAIRAIWYNADGAQIRETQHACPSGWVRAQDLDADLAGQSSQVMIAPDWKAMNVSPKDLGVVADLRVGNGTDWDATEWQASWHNLRGFVRDHPRWMFPPGVNTSRTNVVIRATRGDIDTELLLISGSGDLEFDRSGRVELILYAPDGTRSIRSMTLNPWTTRRIALDELFGDDAKSLMPNGRGYLRVRSNDIDLIAYGISQTEDGGLGLQHLWGY